MTRRVVLAYPGGHGSSAALNLLAGQSEVVAVAADFGAGDVDLCALRRQATADGAAEVVVADLRGEFANDYCLLALQANALILDRHPLVEALARPLLASQLVATARDRNASAVAHGGGDALSGMIATLAPDLEILELGGWGEPELSTSRTLWARAVTSGYRCTEDAVANLGMPDEVVVTFDQGVPVAVDGETVSVAEAMQRLGHRAGAHGIGRFELADSYDAPGAAVLIAAHQELESVTLDRDLARFKRGVDRRWAELVHDGLWFSPLREPLDAFVRRAQERVSGEVRLVLHAGSATVAGLPGRRLRPVGRRCRRATGQTPLGSTQHPSTQAS
ncbi:argininosuccinate synthase domain-containing protein [Amycolatopsis echigonensis]|uniref:argininosuccinate synthase n=1 Tax=Amycolatopsis echigonensis TaxID=2576905 RepID=A0A8E2B8S2_9PSEU|nr:argininosuccinate synthase domain-containing protein [Amycolatopsis echigonensis]MBB2506159.1 argininosuccinate synthase [Amycolatopsis echigonensis]